MSTFSKLTVKQSVDYETGEVKNAVAAGTYKGEREPEYIKLYLADIQRLHNLPASVGTVLYSLIEHASLFPINKEGIVLFINSSLKRDILKATGLGNVQTIDNALHKLVHQGILIRLDRGKYLLSPHLFGVGAWGNIQQIRMTLTYNTLGRSIQTAIEAAKTSMTD